MKHLPKLKTQDLVLFLERLELYISSGLTVSHALDISAQGSSSKQQNMIDNIKRSVESGTRVARAIHSSVKIPNTILGLIEHGELSGDLAGALNSSRILLERQDELRKKCLSAMAYPCIIGIFSVCLTFGLVRGVMPQIIPMLKNLHVALPLLTRVVIYISENFLSKGIYFMGGLFLSMVVIFFLYKKNDKIRLFLHLLLRRLPLLGNLFSVYFLSVFLRSTGSLVESGISASSAYANTVKAISFLPLRLSLESNIPEINCGISIGKTLSIHSGKFIPSYVSPLISAGEASGSLGQSLLRAASIIDRDIEHTLKRLTSLIEPVMMAGMGCVVGAIALSIMMPIYDISKVLQK